jgi:hypothetical protein
MSNCGHPALPPIEVTDVRRMYMEIDFVDVGSAGHMVAVGRNDLFVGAVVDFLARHAEAGETDAG